MFEALDKYFVYLPYLLGGLVWAVIAAPLAGFIARRFGFIDLPPAMRDAADESKDRRKHRKPTPRLGGVMLTLPVLIMPFLLGFSPWVVGLAISVLILDIVALLDDRFEIDAKYFFIALVIVSIIAVFSGIVIKQTQNPFDTLLSFQIGEVSFSLFGLSVQFYILAAFVTVFWLIALSNAINWTDAIGGVASSLCGLALAVSLLVAVREWNHEVAVISAVVLGAIIGFLPLNVIPEKIFVGGGAMTLGFLVAGLSIMGKTKISTWLLVLGLPIVDFAVVIIGRVARAKPRSIKEFVHAITSADRTHLPHKLRSAGLERRQVFWVFVGMTFLFAILALIVSGLLLTGAVVVSCGIILLGYILISRFLKERRGKKEEEGGTPEERFAY